MRRRPAGVRRTILMEWMIISSQKTLRATVHRVPVGNNGTPGFLGNGVPLLKNRILQTLIESRASCLSVS